MYEEKPALCYNMSLFTQAQEGEKVRLIGEAPTQGWVPILMAQFTLFLMEKFTASFVSGKLQISMLVFVKVLVSMPQALLVFRPKDKATRSGTGASQQGEMPGYGLGRGQPALVFGE